MQSRRIVMLLTACVSLVSAGMGIVLPVFPRRLEALGEGPATLAYMTAAYAATGFVFAPLFGALADRWGRKPFVLLALASFALLNVGYLVADSGWSLILLRAVAGALAAGLLPASQAVIGDIARPDERARWMGLLMAGFGIGFVGGPVIGGLLYDLGGFSTPFLLSAGLGLAAMLATVVSVPETVPTRSTVRRREAVPLAVPLPVGAIAVLLLVELLLTFAFGLIEPRLVFHVYDVLGWSSARFGLFVGLYGIAMVVAQTGLAGLSDRFGRRPVIVVGLVLWSAMFFGPWGLVDALPLVVTSVVGGLGTGLVTVAAGALWVDLAPPAIRSRMMGIRSAVSSLGAAAGPAISGVVVETPATDLFLFAAGLVLLTAGAAAIGLPARAILEVRREVAGSEGEATVPARPG